MVDQSKARRRLRQQAPSNTAASTAVAERESYNDFVCTMISNDKKHCNDDNCNDDEYDDYHFRSEIRSGGGDESGHSWATADKYYSSSLSRRYKHKSTQRRIKRKKHRTEKDPPFLILFFQVGTILFVLCLTSYHMYRGIQNYIGPASALVADDNYEYEYVGDTSYGDLIPAQTDYDSNSDPDPVLIPTDSNPKPIRREEGKKLKLNDLLHVTENKVKHEHKHSLEQTNKTTTPLPIFDLSISAVWDAFGIVDKLKEKHTGTDSDSHDRNPSNRNEKSERNESFQQAAQNLRARFAELYGGENAARMLLDKGTTTFSVSHSTGTDDRNMNMNDSNNDKGEDQVPSDVIATACRLHRAKAENRSFTMAFGGYSVTAGRGNKHQDSFPFQLQEILEPIFKTAGFAHSNKQAVLVTNAAIGGVPSFPYGWCMAQFWGGGLKNKDKSEADGNGVPDVVSWDFGMNEASGGPEGLEAYVRHLLSTYSSSLLPPKLIVKDYFTASKRREILADYSTILKDPIILHSDHAVDTMFKATKTTALDTNDDSDSRRPPGFRKWREWGAPKGAPGQAAHHPAVQEHKLNAWILAMHFVAALEYMVAMEENYTKKEYSSFEPNWCPTPTSNIEASLPNYRSYSRPLPPPKSRTIANDTELPYDTIFFGYPTAIEIKNSSSNNDVNRKEEQLSSSQSGWSMNPVFCRTTFEPTVSGDLSEIVVNGTMGEDLDPILPKSQYYYNQGWTYDLSEAERTAKRKLSLYPDGLGFQDSKEAYYGIYESPPMTLLLPYQSDETSDATASSSLLPRTGDLAKDWYESIVLCQVNDKSTLDSAFADASSCNFGNDVGIRIGGVDVLRNETKMLRMIGSVYLGKPICKHVAIPPQANLTSHNTLVREGNDRSSSSSRVMIEGERYSEDSRFLDKDQYGLLVEVFVSNPHIVHVHQACSLSHVIWEQRGS